jgi:hypothetical protein
LSPRFLVISPSFRFISSSTDLCLICSASRPFPFIYALLNLILWCTRHILWTTKLELWFYNLNHSLRPVCVKWILHVILLYSISFISATSPSKNCRS